MGRAVIVSNVGEGLYTIRPDYNMTALEAELAQLQETEAAYSALLLKALNTLDLLRDDAGAAREAMNAVIQQWKDALIEKGREDPGAIAPDDPLDPITGEPWIDPDRAQEGPLLDAINAARTGASVGTVTRDADLDKACLTHLRNQSATGRMGHRGGDGSTPSDRAAQQGYYRPEVIHELLAYGPVTSTQTIQQWQRTHASSLLDGDATHAGVAHVYSSRHPASYLWAVLLASAKGAPVTVTVEPDPPGAAADETEAGLNAIKAPKLESLEPEKLGEVVRLFALAQNKVLAADREVARLQAERLARLERIGVLESLQEETDPIHAWACQYEASLAVGATAQTAEVPGYWRLEEAAAKISTFGFRNDPDAQYPNYTVTYTERPINLIPPGTQSGQLRYSESMTDAAVFLNAAIEPGHLKWKPTWRYGTITALSGDFADVVLEEIAARKLSGRPEEPDLPLDDPLALSSVPIRYPPCNGEVFEVGDEVLILFEGQDRAAPKVIGFRREPRPCTGGRTGWVEL